MTIGASTPSTSPGPTLDAAPHRGRLLVFTLATAVLAYSLMQTLLVPALPLLSQQFELDPSARGWILTSYLLSGAVAAPIFGSLGDRAGHRRLLLISLVVFLVGTALCAIAPTFVVFLAGRVLQGASTAAFPLALAIVRRHLPADAQRSAVGWLSGVLGLGAGVALVLGGIIAELLSWQWLFIAGGAIGAIALVLVATCTPASARSEGARTDWIGATALVIGLLALLIAISQGASWGWASPLTLALLVIAVGGLAALVALERRISQPLVDVRVLARPVMLLANALTLIIGFVPYLFYVGLPVLFESTVGAGHGMAISTAGLAMLPCALLMFAGGRVAPRLLGLMPLWAVGGVAVAVMAAGAAGVAVSTSLPIATVCFFSLVGLGNGIGLTVVSEIVSQRAPRSEVASAVAVNSVVRTVGASLGAPISALFLVDPLIPAGEFAALFAFAALVSVAGIGLAGALRAHP